MRTRASDLLQDLRECLLSPLVNELEMGGRVRLRESHGGGVDCWHFCFDMALILPVFLFLFSALLLLLLLSSHSFRCDVCLDQKSFYVYIQILTYNRTLLSTYPTRVQNQLFRGISTSTSMLNDTEYW